MDDPQAPVPDPDERIGRVVERGVDGGPLHEGESELERALAGRRRGEAWAPAGAPGEWQARSEAGDKRALVKTVAGDYEARVYRHPTGPNPGPDPELSHGPQVFAHPEEALDYAEAQLGWVAATNPVPRRGPASAPPPRSRGSRRRRVTARSD